MEFLDLLFGGQDGSGEFASYLDLETWTNFEKNVQTWKT